MNPIIDEYLKKYNQDAENAAAAEAESQKSGLGWAQFGASIGDAFAGRSPNETAKNFDQIRKSIDDNTVGRYLQNKKMAQDEMEKKQKFEQFDPGSNASVSYRKMMEAKFPEVAKSYGDQWNMVSAGDADSIFRPLQLKEQIDARKEQARILAGNREETASLRKDLQEQRLADKEAALMTPFGIANTPDDAKQLKEAFEAKRNFDDKIQEMMDLRSKHKGGAIMDREDVARGKQLSKDLLLEYKNMSKLGVLSKSDEDIINAIIPEDPLQYNSPLAYLQGQDPTANRLKKFKESSDKDFKTRVSTRTRDGVATAAAPQKTIVKTQTNQKTGQKRIVYSDGTTEIVDQMAGR